jgi:exo-1,4-beta-D-glucosaminidase
VPGTYFGAKKANEDVHALFDEARRTIAIANVTARDQPDLTLEVVVHGLDGAELDRQSVAGVALGPLEVRRDLATPKLPAATAAPTPATVSFIELTLRQAGEVRSRNVYWVSSQADVVDWAQTTGKSFATMQQHADLTSLQTLAPAQVTATATTRADAGDPTRARTAVTITNTSTTPIVGFFLRADLRRGHDGRADAGDNAVLPVLWSDNDLTLWPGESQTIEAGYRRADLRGAQPVVTITGWNTAGVTVAAP